jgi:chemotaxis protein MotA
MAATRTDISTAVGIVAVFSFVSLAIVLGSDDKIKTIQAFIDVPSILIVIGGTFAIVTASFTIPEIFRSQGLMFKTIFYRADNATHIARKLIELAEEARKNGVLALQSFLNQPGGDPYLKKGLAMIVDGMEPDIVEGIMRQEMNHMIDRHSRGVSILRKSSETAPAMGLIGTLIGLIQMLGSLNDPSKIGPAMAIALLTTFYGALLSYAFFSPLANKLERNTRDEAMVMSLFVKGMVSVGKKENPRRLEMQLNSILPPSKRIKYFD